MLLTDEEFGFEKKTKVSNILNLISSPERNHTEVSFREINLFIRISLSSLSQSI